MSKQLLTFLFILFTFFIYQKSYSQDKSTLSGYITDGQSGEEMIGVKIYIPSIKKGTLSNSYGFYSITVPKGSYEIEFRSAVHPTERKLIKLDEDLKYNLEIGANIQQIEEITVNAKKGENVNSTANGPNWS